MCVGKQKEENSRRIEQENDGLLLTATGQNMVSSGAVFAVSTSDSTIYY
jgi:hypothetical protein